MTILIIDLHSVLHNIKHGVGKVSKLKTDEAYTFIIYGFLIKLKNIMRLVSHDHVVFACDSDENKRFKIYKKYKYSRVEKSQDQIDMDAISYPQFTLIKEEILPKIGFRNIFEVKGYEADDIIAHVCQQYKNDNKIIVTTDKDMYQCLDEKTWMLKHDKMKIYSHSDFQNEYDIDPKLWARVKAYGGCNTDKVPGIPVYDKDGNLAARGIGEKTAIKFLQGKLKPGSNVYKAFTDERNRKVLQRNKALTVLPLGGLRPFRITSNSPSILGMQFVIRKYKFRSFAQDFDSFRLHMGLK